MKKQGFRINTVSTVAGLGIAALGIAFPQQSKSQDLVGNSYDQFVQVGETASFYVEPMAGDTFQWFDNGAPMSGQTNSTLTIDHAQIGDAGYYSCNIANGADVVPTVSASLELFTVNPDFSVVVFGAPIVSSGSSGTCPGSYAGYVTYTLSVSNGWGWVPMTNTTIYTASDTTRTNTKVEYVGDYGDEGCAQTTVTIPYPAFSPAYRFAIYFTNNVPTTNYPITLVGFNP